MCIVYSIILTNSVTLMITLMSMMQFDSFVKIMAMNASNGGAVM